MSWVVGGGSMIADGVFMLLVYHGMVRFTVKSLIVFSIVSGLSLIGFGIYFGFQGIYAIIG